MRVVTWNIRGGGGSGVPRVADVLRVLDADLAVLTEATAKRTAELATALRDRGLPCADHLLGLHRRGWRSAFRAVHAEAQAHSGWSHPGNGFRIDDVLLGPGFHGTVSAAQYIVSAREHVLAWNHHGSRPPSTLSDHAALVVDLEVSAGSPH